MICAIDEMTKITDFWCFFNLKRTIMMHYKIVMHHYGALLNKADYYMAYMFD